MLFQNHFPMQTSQLIEKKKKTLNAGCWMQAAQRWVYTTIISTVLEEFSFFVCSPLKYVVALSYPKMSFMTTDIQKILDRVVVDRVKSVIVVFHEDVIKNSKSKIISGEFTGLTWWNLLPQIVTNEHVLKIEKKRKKCMVFLYVSCSKNNVSYFIVSPQHQRQILVMWQ